MANHDQSLLAHYRNEIMHESALLSARLNSYITTQSFLMIAYASAMSGLIGQWREVFTLLFPVPLAMLGLVLSLQARPGVKAAYAVIEDWRQRQNELLDNAQDLADYDLHAGERSADGNHGAPSSDRQFHRGELFARHAPGLFIAAWCYLLILPVVLYVME